MNSSEHTLQHASPLQEDIQISTVQERSYTEHRILRGAYGIYAHHCAGTGPALVLMHGFPDNLHIYDRLIPYLRDRQVITLDFLGWGTSDKPIGYPYTSKQQEGDLQAVLDTLGAEQVVLVPHDASGPVAINWALDHPERVSALVLLNTYYAEAPTLRFPEFIALFADPAYAALTRAMAQEPTVAQWLLNWQGEQFGAEGQGQETLRPIVLHEFAGTPSTFPAFISLTSDLHATLRADTQRLPELKTFERPVRIIFGAGDPYLNPGVAEHFHEAFPTSELFLLHKGHWPQLDGPEEVASLLLSVPITTKH
jgi:haloalkane dehalogenase